MKSITVMALRSNHGKMMMRAFRAKSTFHGMTEDAFLNILARDMNTSPEQLINKYSGIDRLYFES